MSDSLRAVWSWIAENKEILTALGAVVGILAALNLIRPVQNGIGRVARAAWRVARRDSIQLVSEYLDNLERSLDSLPWWGTEQDAPKLRAYFVPLVVSARIHPSRRLRTLPDSSTATRMEDILRDASKRRVVLLGEPGSGKTTLLRNTCLLLVDQDRRTAQLPRLPVFIRIKEWMAERAGTTLLEEVRYQLASHLGPANAAASERLSKLVLGLAAKGRVVVCLDGLDEVSDEGYEKAAAAISDGSESGELESCRILTSCRTQVYRPSTVEAEAVVEIREFEEGDIRDFLSRFCWEGSAEKSGDSLFLALRATPQLLKCCRNPLRLSIVVSLYRAGSDIPESEAELYHEFCRHLISTRELVLQGRTIKGEEAYALLLPILTTLAFRRHSAAGLGMSEYTRFSLAQVEAAAIEVLGHPSSPTFYLDSISAKELSSAIVARSSLISLRARDQYEFSHLTFQEFLAAEYLTQAEDELDYLARYMAVDHAKWRHVLLLNASAHEDAAYVEALITRLRDMSFPDLAGICVGSAHPRVVPSLSRAIVSSLIDDLHERINSHLHQDAEAKAMHDLFSALAAISAHDTAWGSDAFLRLESFVGSDDRAIQSHAISALGRIRSPASVGVLRRVLLNETMLPVVEEALIRVGTDGSEAVADILQTSSPESVCMSCLRILEATGGHAALEAVAGALYHEVPETAFHGALALGRMIRSPEAQRHVEEISLPASYSAVRGLAAGMRNEVWPFSPPTSNLARLVDRLTLVIRSVRQVPDATVMACLDDLDSRVAGALAIRYAEAMPRHSKPPLPDTVGQLRNFASEPTPQKAFVVVLGYALKRGLKSAVRNWNRLPDDIGQLDRSLKGASAWVVNGLYFTVQAALPAAAWLATLVFLIARAFGRGWLPATFGMLAWWHLLVLFLTYPLGELVGFIYAHAMYLEVDDDSPRLVRVLSSLRGTAGRLAGYSLLGLAYFLIVVRAVLRALWLGLPWGLGVGLAISVLLELFHVARFRLSRDALFRRVNPFLELVLLGYLSEQDVVVSTSGQ
jgi:energy-coupling factor transporter ATP-binding protein EcfA2